MLHQTHLGHEVGTLHQRRRRVAPGEVLLSSRRRHTRFDCDWSSDVCSSDLGETRSTPIGHIYMSIANISTVLQMFSVLLDFGRPFARDPGKRSTKVNAFAGPSARKEEARDRKSVV